MSVLGASEGYSSSTASEQGEHTEQDAVSSKKPDSDKKDSQPAGDKNSKGLQNTSQPTGDSISPCLENDLQHYSGAQQSTEARGVVMSQSTCSQNSCAAKSTENDEHPSILKRTSEASPVSNLPTVEQIPQIEAKQTVPEDLNKQSPKLSAASQEASKRGEGLNLISKLVEVEPAKQFTGHTKIEDTALGKPLKDSRKKGSSSSGSPPSDVFQDGRTKPTKQTSDHKQTDYPSFAKSPKDVKRKGSSSSVSALSDIIQDIKTSPRDTNISAENIPTKGMKSGLVFTFDYMYCV